MDNGRYSEFSGNAGLILHDSSESASFSSPNSMKPPNEGKAKFKYASGPVKAYEGEFKAGMRHGQGAAIFGDGHEYKGYWCLDKKHGMGDESDAENTNYRGEFNNGLRHGKGMEITVYGDEYNG